MTMAVAMPEKLLFTKYQTESVVKAETAIPKKLTARIRVAVRR